MGRYTGPKVRLSRREGVNLTPKAEKIMAKRNYIPGQHGPTARGRKLTNYGVQLREKQKAKRFYGLLENQFRKYYDRAMHMAGNNSENLITLLERRLDNVIYRLGLGTTREQARQLVNHGHILVDGKKVDVPSFQTKPSMVITVKQNKINKAYWQNLKQRLTNTKHLLSWLDLDVETFNGKIIALPKFEETPILFDPKLIIEFYSR